MKPSPLLATTLILSLSVAGCYQDEVIPELAMMPAPFEQKAELPASLDRMLELSPSAAGLETIPTWKTLSYSEDIGDAFAERIAALDQKDHKFD